MNMIMRCGVCMSDRLSESYQWNSFEQHFTVPEAGRAFIGVKDLKVDAAFVRVCLACGHIMGFVDPEMLVRIQKKSH